MRDDLDVDCQEMVGKALEPVLIAAEMETPLVVRRGQAASFGMRKVDWPLSVMVVPGKELMLLRLQ